MADRFSAWIGSPLILRPYKRISVDRGADGQTGRRGRDEVSVGAYGVGHLDLIEHMHTNMQQWYGGGIGALRRGAGRGDVLLR